MCAYIYIGNCVCSVKPLLSISPFCFMGLFTEIGKSPDTAGLALLSQPVVYRYSSQQERELVKNVTRQQDWKDYLYIYKALSYTRPFKEKLCIQYKRDIKLLSSLFYFPRLISNNKKWRLTVKPWKLYDFMLHQMHFISRMRGYKPPHFIYCLCLKFNTHAMNMIIFKLIMDKPMYNGIMWTFVIS